jgi:hypothetical protein
MTTRPRPGTARSHTDSSDALILRSPDAVVAAIPYLLGFVPTDSAVVVWIGHRRVILTQRLDLPSTDRETPGWLSAMWDHGGARMADEVIVVLVTDREDAPGLVGAIGDRAAHAGISVRDALRTSGTRWWSLLCHDSECCSPGGRLVDPRVAAAVAAEFTVLGVAPMPTRDDLVESLEPDPDAAAAVRRELEGLSTPQDGRSAKREQWRDRTVGLTMRVLAAEAVSVGEVARIVSGMDDIRVRDTVLWECARLDPEDLRGVLEQLAHVVRTAPCGAVAPVAASYAVIAWLAGDGARSLIAADRALADDPEYSLAALVVASLRAGLPPDQWRSAMRAMPREECRRPSGSATTR